MKFFLPVCLIFVLIGTSIGWAVNHYSFGWREARFGELRMDGSVGADNLREHLVSLRPNASAKAELVNGDTYDFGSMAQGEKGEHTFVIKNVGNAPLTLKKGASTCKCTLANLEKGSLAPGEQTTVKLEWTVQTAETQFSQNAEIRTNDATIGAISLQIRGKVYREVEFVPEDITFGEIAADDAFEFAGEMYSYLDDTITIEKVSFGSQRLTALSEIEWEEIPKDKFDLVHEKAKQGFKFLAKVKPGLDQGSVSTPLKVQFSKASEPESKDPSSWYVTTVSCAGSIVGELTVLKTSLVKTSSNDVYYLDIGDVGPNDDLEYPFLLKLKGSQAAKTNLSIGACTPKDTVSATIEELGKANQNSTSRTFRVKVKLTPGQSVVDLRINATDNVGWVTIESDNPKVPALRVALNVKIESVP